MGAPFAYLGETKANSAKLKMEFGLSLATFELHFKIFLINSIGGHCKVLPIGSGCLVELSK